MTSTFTKKWNEPQKWLRAVWWWNQNGKSIQTNWWGDVQKVMWWGTQISKIFYPNVLERSGKDQRIKRKQNVSFLRFLKWFFVLNKKTFSIQSLLMWRSPVGSGRETYEDIRCVFEQTFRQAERNIRGSTHTYTQSHYFPKFKQIENVGKTLLRFFKCRHIEEIITRERERSPYKFSS